MSDTDEELEYANNLSKKLAKHLLNMGADNMERVVDIEDRSYQLREQKTREWSVNEIHRLQLRTEELEAKLAAQLREQLDRTTKDRADAQYDRQVIRGERDAANARIAELMELISAPRHAGLLETLEAERDNLRQELTGAKDEIAALKEDRDRLTTELLGYSNRECDYRQRIEILREAINTELQKIMDAVWFACQLEGTHAWREANEQWGYFNAACDRLRKAT